MFHYAEDIVVDVISRKKSIWALPIFCTVEPPHTTTVLRPFFRDHPGARRELLDFMVQEKINRDRHTNNPAGRAPPHPD